MTTMYFDVAKSLVSVQHAELPDVKIFVPVIPLYTLNK